MSVDLDRFVSGKPLAFGSGVYSEASITFRLTGQTLYHCNISLFLNKNIDIINVFHCQCLASPTGLCCNTRQILDRQLCLLGTATVIS